MAEGLCDYFFDQACEAAERKRLYEEQNPSSIDKKQHDTLAEMKRQVEILNLQIEVIEKQKRIKELSK